MIEKQIIIEGMMRYDEEQSNETAMLQDYRVEAVTKGATYTLIDPLPYDFIVQNLFYRVTEAFDGTVTVGTDAQPERFLAAADFRKTVGKKSTAKSIMIEAGNHRQDRDPCDGILAETKSALK